MYDFGRSDWHANTDHCEQLYRLLQKEEGARGGDEAAYGAEEARGQTGASRDAYESFRRAGGWRHFSIRRSAFKRRQLKISEMKALPRLIWLGNYAEWCS